jgi:hypothetical protein
MKEKGLKGDMQPVGRQHTGSVQHVLMSYSLWVGITELCWAHKTEKGLVQYLQLSGLPTYIIPAATENADTVSITPSDSLSCFLLKRHNNGSETRSLGFLSTFLLSVYLQASYLLLRSL